MKYFIFLFIVCSFSNVKADFCDPSLWQNIATSKIYTGIYAQGWDVNQDCLDENGRPTTPLHVAAANPQNIYALIALIMEGANLLAVNDADQTPFAVLRELDKTMYGQLQQASYRWNNLVKEEYEQAQNRITQGIQNESNPEMVDEMEAALQEISNRWERLGQIPFDEAQARYNQTQQALEFIRIFTQTSLAMLSSEYETYTPLVTDETYSETRDIRDFLSFANEKLMALGLDPITSSLLPMLFGSDDERNPDVRIYVPEDTDFSEIDLIASQNDSFESGSFTSILNKLSSLFDELCPNADAIDLCEIINNQFNNIRYTPQAFETITASILWDLIYALNAIYQNINDLALTIDATEYTGRIIDIRDELVDLEVQVRDRFGDDTRYVPDGEIPTTVEAPINDTDDGTWAVPNDNYTESLSVEEPAGDDYTESPSAVAPEPAGNDPVTDNYTESLSVKEPAGDDYTESPSAVAPEPAGNDLLTTTQNHYRLKNRLETIIQNHHRL